MRSICQDVIKNYVYSWGLLLTSSYLYIRAPGRAHLFGAESSLRAQEREIVSRTARASVVRRNLKEAAGKESVDLMNRNRRGGSHAWRRR